ncbi:unnamed protein product, partial [Chrysoparadoxa australica]
MSTATRRATAAGAGGGDAMEMEALDFDSLLAGSQKLTSHIRKDGLPLTQQNLWEIEAASKKLGESAQTLAHGGTSAAEQSALRLLSTRNFDAEQLGTEVTSMQLQATYEPLEPLGETDIDGYLAHHHDMIVVTAVQEANKAAQDMALLQQKEWEWDDWRRGKQLLMEDMGHKAGHWGVRDPSYREGRSAAGGVLNGVGGAVAKLAGAEGIRPPSPMPATSLQSQLTHEMRWHADVVRQLNTSELTGRGGDTQPQPVALFCKVAETLVPAGAFGGPASMYARAWRLLWHIVEDSGKGNGSVQAKGEEARVNRYARGTHNYLSELSQEMVRRSVDTAAARGQLRDPPGRSHTAGLEAYTHAYVQLQRVLNQLPPGCEQPVYKGESLWAQVYWCVRCGGIDEAQAVCEGALKDAVADTALQGVKALLAGECDDATEAAARREYERLVAKSSFDSAAAGGGRDINLYKQLLLNLLLGAEAKHSAYHALQWTIEDYMWFKLWFVLEPHPAQGEGLRDLQAKIADWGPGHFDEDRRKPFAYVNVLLMSLQFTEAIKYLWQAGLVIQAVHFSIALKCHGILESPPPPAAAAEAGALVLRGSDQQQYSEDMSEEAHAEFSFPRLITLYTQRIQASDPEVAVEYLLRIKQGGENAAFVAAIQRLLLETRHYSILAGEIGSNGQRTMGGTLDVYLPPREVQVILEQTARRADAQGMAADAISLYGLAGAYAQVLHLLNAQLGSVLVPPNPARKAWEDLAMTFYEKHLKDGQTYVQEQLKDEPKVGVTFQMLLNLLLFFDHCDGSKWSDALSLLDSLALLPKNEESLTLAVESYSQLDEAVRSVFADIVLRAMDCMYHLHADVKRQWYIM